MTDHCLWEGYPSGRNGADLEIGLGANDPHVGSNPTPSANFELLVVSYQLPVITSLIKILPKKKHYVNDN